MKFSVKLALCLLAVCVASPLVPAQTTSPNAYVYVIQHLISDIYELDGFKTDSTGALTPLPGSPFWKTTKTIQALAHTTNWMFVSDGTNIYTFSIASSGALTQKSSVNAAKFYGFDGLTGANLVLDHTGTTLYGLAADGLGDNEFQFFAKNSSNGSLSFTGSTADDISYSELDFTSNNLYAYGFGCFQDESHAYAFRRGSDGTLTKINVNMPLPTAPKGDDYCLVMGAGVPANRLAVAMYLETPTQPPFPPAALGVYAADSSGNLSTTSTSQNMPTADVGLLNDLTASPAGNLLAVAGTQGLQIFHFNGSKPITAYTGLLAVHYISHIQWDSHDHLFGISPVSGLVYAFKITSTGHKQATGSPYKIERPIAITVLSK